MILKESIPSTAISSPQRRVWNLQKDNGHLYVQCVVEISTSKSFNPSKIDSEKFHYAATYVLDKYDALNTSYHWEDTQLSETRIFDNSKGINFEIIDLQGEQDYDQYLSYQRRKITKANNSSSALLNILFLRTSDNHGFLLLLIPAIAADSTSLKNIVKDLCNFYLDQENGNEEAIISYQKFCNWQQELLQDPGEEVNAFWKKYNYKEFKNIKLPFELNPQAHSNIRCSKNCASKNNGKECPKRRASCIHQSQGIYTQVINGFTFEKLKSLSSKYEMKLEVILLTCLNILLSKYTLASRASIGVVVNERMFEELNPTVGLIAKVLPLMVETEPSSSPVELFHQINNTIKDITEFQEGFDIDQELGEKGFFPIGFESIQLTENLSSGAITFNYKNFISNTDHFKLKLVAVEKNNSLILDFYFDPNYFNQEAIETIALHYKTLLNNILENPAKEIADYDTLSSSERNKILNEFNPLTKHENSSKLIIELFEKHAENSPEATALVTKSGKLTYGEVNTLSNKLAHYLREEYNVKANDIVGILLDRSEWMVISVLAILKSGAAYLPIDPEYPKERRKYLLEDSKTQVLITESGYMFELDGYQGQLFAADLQIDSLETSGANPAAIHKNTDLAYVIYTSGSTGLPKGCLLEHHNLFNYITWANAYYFEDDSCGDFDLFSSLSFDFTITSIFCPLTRGKLINIFDQSTEINKVLEQSFSPSSLTDTIKLTPSHISLLQYLNISSTRIKKVITGGEALTMKHVEILKNIDPAIEVFNEYGPTEATVGCIVKKVEREDGKVLIGSPITNTRIYILNLHLDLCPVAMSGEIYIAGEGLARGYLNRNDLNLQRFISSPFQFGEFLYKTGDTGRWLPDGNIEYLGRNDDQVKINGYRVELGEIEQYLLNNYKEFKEVAIITRQDKENTLFLTAYIVTDHKLDSSALRSSLAASLPEYMIPRYFVKMEKLPLTVNGKINKSLLPDPEITIKEALTYESPRTPMEHSLQGLWQEVLGIERVGIKDKFLEIGGHSLRAVQLVSRIYKELQIQVELRDIFEYETIEGLAAFLDKSTETKYEKIVPVAEQAYYDLSHGQKRLWILDQLGVEKSAYHVLGSYQLEGALNQAAVEWAMSTIIDRHEILRTNFTVVEGEPKQKIHSVETCMKKNFTNENENYQQVPDGHFNTIRFSEENNNFKIAYKDLRGTEEAEALAKELVSAQVNKSFDLSNDSLVRCLLIQTGEQKHILVLVMHHIISDGWSMEVLVKEFLKLYDGYLKGSGNELVPLRIQYKDYAGWQQHQLSDDQLSAGKQYWTEEFNEAAPALDLPSDRARPAQRTYNGSREAIGLSKELSAKLRSYSQSKGASLFMSLLGGVKALLFKYSHQEDIVIGTPVAGRDHYDLEDQIGLYINTIAIRTKFSGEESLGKLIDKVKEKTVSGFNHQQYPFDYLVESIVLERDASRNPIFDVLVALQNISLEGEVESMEGIRVSPYQTEQAISKFDLTFNFIDGEEEIRGVIEYNSDLYDKERIERMTGHYEQIISKLVEDDQVLLKDLEYITQEERYQLLESFNDTYVSYPKEKTIQRLFEEQVMKTPEATAVVFGETKLSYKALNEQSNQLAHYLRETYDIKADDLIGIMTDRSAQMLISILGILKSGAAYLPIDPGYPQDRIRFTIQDSSIKTLITDASIEKTAGIEGSVEVLRINEKKEEISKLSKDNPEEINTSKNLAYVIYTSGSTGKPKGVMVEHASLVNTCFWHKSTYEVSQLSKATLYAGIGFDASVWEVWPYLLSGSTLFPVNDTIKLDLYRLASFLNENQITHSYLPTVICEQLNALTEVEFSKDLHILTGGDELKNVERIASNIFNNYGPTESTIVATSFKLQDFAFDRRIPIGKPISNTKIYILHQNQLQPIGVPGELYIAGEGVARGYLNQPELTADKFQSSSFAEGEVLYRTGDLAQWLNDGNIEFLGRTDFQVKIRCYRIELGEIENTILKYENIKSALVEVAEDQAGNKSLAAYLVTDGDFDIDSLKSYLSKILPDHMIPSFFVLLDAFPTNTSGKINRKALPDPFIAGLRSDQAYESAQTLMEQKLQVLWEEVLGIKRVGIKDKFLGIGGHSLRAVQLISRIYKELQIQVELRDIFEQETIQGLAKLLEKSTETTYQKIAPVAEQAYYDLSHGQKRLWILDQLGVEKSAYHVLGSYELEGDLNQAAVEWAMTTIIDRHEILRTNFTVIEGIPKQKIHSAGNNNFKISFKDLRGIEEADALAKELVSAQVNKGFDLSNDFLVRSLLIQTGEERHILVLVMHHIISDGWSMEVLVKEFLRLYDGYLKGKSNELAPLRIQYKDYAGWQQRQLSEEQLSASKQYWIEEFKETIPVLDLPSDRARPAQKTYNGSREAINLNKELSSRLRSYSQSKGASLFMSLLGGVKALLFKYSHQEDIVIGTPVAGRDHYDLEDQIGLYINTIAIRTKFSSEDSLSTLIEKVKEKTVSGFDHQQYPFDYLVDNVVVERDSSRNPIFDILVAFQNNSSQKEIDSMEGIQVNPYLAEQTISKFDLTFNFTDGEEEIKGVVEYNSDLYDKERIERMIVHYELILRRLIEDDRILLKDLEYITYGERYQLLEGFNNTKANYPKEKTIQRLFEEQVLRTPEATAVVFGETRLSYRDLNEQSNQLAHYLRDTYEIRADDLIGIMTDRSEQMIIGILGILKSGAAYLPIDPSYPEDRIRFTIEDSSIKTLITDASIEKLGGIETEVEVLRIDEKKDRINKHSKDNPEEINTSKNLAYVIYTSGSTGKPKGVLVEHKNVVRLLFNDEFQFNFDENDTWTVFHSICFDFSVWEIYGAILYGGKLVVVPKNTTLDPEEYLRLLEKEKVTVLNQIPSTFKGIAQQATENQYNLSLRYVIFGGEALNPQTLRKWHIAYPEVKIVNMYGITETTVHVTYKEITEAEIASGLSNTGRPIPTNKLYVFDRFNKLVPIGVVGELVVGGAGVSRGYLNRKALTKEKFIKNPYKVSETIYKTGDLGMRLSNGEIVYCGRNDHQVKIRGFRIELGEIENRLLKYKNIENAIVLDKEDNLGDKFLIAYLLTQEEYSLTDLRSYLKEALPDYMIPAHFIFLQALPLTSTGKLNRDALPLPEVSELRKEVKFEAPQNEVESQIKRIWEDILSLEPVGTQDNFFQLGGNSLKIISTYKMINTKYPDTLKITDLFDAPTIKDQARLIQYKLQTEEEIESQYKILEL